MLKEVLWPGERHYKSGRGHEPLEFYLNALTNSSQLDLLLGYFSFSAIHVLAAGFARFLYNGGTLRIVANHFLSTQDKEVLMEAREGDIELDLIDINNLANLRSKLDEYGSHFFRCLAWLIKNERIEIVLVKPKGKVGISHYKSGIFKDGRDTVKFKASCNFTPYGLLENLEEVDIHLSWDGSHAVKNIEGQDSYFEEIFNGKADFVDYLSIENISTNLTDEFGGTQINELLIEEGELIRKKAQSFEKGRLKKLLTKLDFESLEIARQPKFPFPAGPRDYQREAYENWVANEYNGIFAMATGTGKTITALNCLLEESRKDEEGIYHALILVPTITLVEQWCNEVKLFNFQDVITVSSKDRWESKLATTLSIARRIPTSFIIVGTYASFIRDRFHSYVDKFPRDTVFIADEAHNVGARSVMEKLKAITLEKRIGLSATPKRSYDPEGSRAMELFFQDKEPYTYTFSMEKAITEGILCQYNYHPHLVELTSHELEEYVEISKKLARFYNPSRDDLEKNDIAERLLLKRKRIIHKAEHKLSKTIAILQQRYELEGTLEYTFVYVPEGYVNSAADDDDVKELDDENLRIINQYTGAIGKIDPNILINQFIGGMPDRDDVLEQFKNGKIQVIASMKCLDEGVDIPRAQHAIFCSSTGNPRQFIQRRGRILRKHPDKHKATIHDLVVIPDLTSSSINADTYKLERNMVKKEIERVMYFASISENPYETEHLLEEVCGHYDLNIYTIYEELKTA